MKQNKREQIRTEQNKAATTQIDRINIQHKLK